MINPLLPPQMNNPKEMMDNIKKMNEQIIQQNHKALRNLFKKEIKESFLIQMSEKVKVDHPDIFKYYKNAFNMSLESILQGIDDRIDYDICCHIVGIHKSNILFLRDDEKGNLQNDSKYKQQLSNKVYEHIKLRQFGSLFFRNQPFMSGDRFLYFKLGYDLFVMTTYMLNIVDKTEVKASPFHRFYTSILSELISVLTLIENGLLMQTFPQCRNLIELYFKYEVLFKNPQAIDEYMKFTDYEIHYTCYYEYPKEFLDKYNKCGKNISIIDYLHYGWIDAIFDFGYLEKDKKYSIPGLYNYLKMLKKPNRIFDELKDLHNRCHMFSHGTTITKTYPIQTYFEIMPILFYTVRGIVIDIANILQDHLIFNDVEMLDMLNSDWNEFSKKSKIMNIDNVKQYYGIK